VDDFSLAINDREKVRMRKRAIGFLFELHAEERGKFADRVVCAPKQDPILIKLVGLTISFPISCRFPLNRGTYYRRMPRLCFVGCAKKWQPRHATRHYLRMNRNRRDAILMAARSSLT
jgi:hypothetical protein